MLDRRVAPAAVLLALVSGACARPRDAAERFGGATICVNVARVAAGDDARWAQPGWDDTTWPTRVLYRVPAEFDRFWIRHRLVLPEPLTGRPVALYVSVLGSFEVYWDGERVGTSGAIPADGRADRPGPLDNFFILDRAYTRPGTHTLALRVARGSDAEAPAFFQGIALGEPDHMLRSRVAGQVVPLAGLGAFVLVAVYCAALWWTGLRRPSLVVFSALCAASAMLVVAEAWRWMVGYPYDWHLFRLQVVLGLTAAIAWMLPLFFALELGLARPRRWAAAFGLLVLAVALRRDGYDDRCLQLFALGVLLSVAAVAAAGRGRARSVALPVLGLGVLAVALFAGGHGFSDSGFFVAFCALISTVLVALAASTRREREDHQRAVLRAARLEVELLEKSIQPHFVMNTLTAVMEWVEADPREGLRFLDALAEELRIFSEMSRQTQVPLRRELELCRTHLELMGCRHGARFDLIAEGIDLDAVVPPAIFHTLIENAFTHGGGQAPMVFSLRESRVWTRRRYVLDAPVGPAHSAPAREDGVGMRYVRARLQQSFPGDWRLDAGLIDGFWRTTIEVPA